VFGLDDLAESFGQIVVQAITPAFIY